MKNTLLLTASAAILLLAGVLAGPATAAGTPRCTNSDLRASYRHTDDGAGHVFGRIVLTNRSTHACRTGGFGGLSYVGHGNGTQIGAAADRDGGWRSYVVRPGHRLVSPVSATRAVLYPAARCHRVHVDGFRVYVPDATRSQYVPHPTTGCANPAVHLLSHRAFRRP